MYDIMPVICLCIGWMAQFSGDARTDIVCKADGTIRKGEPGYV